MTVAIAVTPSAAVRDAERLNALCARVSRRILPLILIGYIVAYLDRVNIGFAKLQMLTDLRFSDTVYGLGAGCFFLGYFLFEVPSNMMLQRVGARAWIARIMITWGLLSAAMVAVKTPGAFYTLRFLLGAAEAGFFPGVIFYLTQWYPANRRGRITALFMTGIAVSSALGSLLSGWILQTFAGVHGLEGWQWLFLIEAIPAIALGLYIPFGLTDNISSARWLSDAEKLLLQGALSGEAGVRAAHSVSQAFRDARVWLACLIYFCLVIGLYGIGFWLPTILFDLGITRPVDIGLIGSIPYGLAAIGMVLIARSADRRNERRWHVAVPALLGGAGLVLSVLFAGHPLLAIGALSLAALGILACLPLFWSLPTAYLRDEAAAAGIALINSFGNLAGFVSPFMVGATRDFTGRTDVGMYLIAAFLTAGALLVLIFIPAHATRSVTT